MAGTQPLLAVAMAFFLAGIPGSGKADALGIVVLADHANSRQIRPPSRGPPSSMATGFRRMRAARCGYRLAGTLYLWRTKAA